MASSTVDPVLLDGRTLEGGGQLLRLALCLSALTSIPIKVHSIRGNRSGGGGLKAQHLACVNWLAHACRARIAGAEKGSKELLFVPGGDGGSHGGLSPAFKKVMVRSGDGDEMKEVYEAKLDIKTAGSTGLALQAILPFILFASFPSPLPVRLTLSGGTNVSQSPSYEYITQVLLPTLQTIGFPATDAKLGKRGWSHGGSSIGNFTLEIPHRVSTILPAFSLTPPASDDARPKTTIQHLHATFIAPGVCHDHFQKSLKKNLKYHFPTPHHPSFTEAHGNLTFDLEDSRHPKRMYFVLVATIIYHASDSGTSTSGTRTFKFARDYLYDRKLPQKASGSSHDSAAETMADRVCGDLAAEVESGACVDEFMRDQLVVFQALAKGKSVVFAGRNEDGELRGPSLHAQTAEWVAERLLGGKGVDFDGRGIGIGAGFAEGGDKEVEEGLEDEMGRLEIK